MESQSISDMSNDEFVSFLKSELVGMILTLHDISSKKRRQAKLAMRELCDRANFDYQLQETLVSTAIACLAGASDTIKAGVIESLGFCAYLLEDCEELKKRFINIILLLDVSSPQIARSLVKFLRLSIQGISDPETITLCFDFFIKSILGSSMARAACRVRIRTLIEKLSKKFGWDTLEKRIPEAHIKLFRYVRRMYNRRVRKAVAASEKRDLDEELDDSESETEDFIEETQRKQRLFDTSGESSKKAGMALLMKDDIENPLDLLSGEVSFVKKPSASSKTEKSKIKTTSDGRLVVHDEDHEDEGMIQSTQIQKRVSLSDLAELRDRHNALKKAKLAESVTFKKQSMIKKSETQIAKRNRRKHDLIGLTQYAPKKANAFGDSKKSDQDTDPYAYIRLNPSLVREKYKGNAVNSLSQVIRKTGQKSVRPKRVAPGRSGIDGSMFVSKPAFKKRVLSTPGAIKKKAPRGAARP